MVTCASLHLIVETDNENTDSTTAGSLSPLELAYYILKECLLIISIVLKAAL